MAINNGLGLLDEEQKSHWDSLRIWNGAISTSPKKLGLKKEGNSCSDQPSVNRDLAEAKAHLPNLKKEL